MINQFPSISVAATEKQKRRHCALVFVVFCLWLCLLTFCIFYRIFISSQQMQQLIVALAVAVKIHTHPLLLLLSEIGLIFSSHRLIISLSRVFFSLVLQSQRLKNTDTLRFKGQGFACAFRFLFSDENANRCPSRGGLLFSLLLCYLPKH